MLRREFRIRYARKSVIQKMPSNEKYGKSQAADHFAIVPVEHFNADDGAASLLLEGGRQGTPDPYILINGFGEGYGDPDTWKHLVVTDDGKVVCDATSEGFKKGTAWLHELYAQGLIDPETFTQEWSTYVAKGKSGRYGVLFTWTERRKARPLWSSMIRPSTRGSFYATQTLLAPDGRRIMVLVQYLSGLAGPQTEKFTGPKISIFLE